MDLVHTAASWIEKNRYTALAAVAGAAMLLVVGCVPGLTRVPSPFDPEGAPVTIRELDIQAERFQAELQAEQATDEATTEAQINALIVDLNARTADRTTHAQVVGAEVEARVLQIQERQAFVMSVAEKVGAALGVFSPQAGAIFGGIATLVASGLALDNRRKNVVIKGLKQATA